MATKPETSLETVKETEQNTFLEQQEVTINFKYDGSDETIQNAKPIATLKEPDMDKSEEPKTENSPLPGAQPSTPSQNAENSNRKTETSSTPVPGADKKCKPLKTIPTKSLNPLKNIETTKSIKTQNITKGETMASKPKKSLPNSKVESLNPEELRESHSRLLVDLESERKLVKMLRREKSYEVQQARDLEQTKASVAVKDLRTKLHQERSKDLEGAKDTLSKKFELDIQMVTRQKEAELMKLRTDLQKCQGELKEVREQNKNYKRGLSGTSARGAFDSERSRLLRENKVLRSGRGQLEEKVKLLAAAEKQKAAELNKFQETARAEQAKARRDTDAEIKKLLEELKSKERQAWQMEKEHGARAGYSAATLLQSDTPTVHYTAVTTTDTLDHKCRCQQTDGTIGVKKDKEYIATEIASPQVDLNTGGAPQQQVAELMARVTELQKLCGSLKQEKNILQQKIKEVEQKQKNTLEKNKQFLEKNIEVTNINRCLEDKLKKLSDEVGKLRNQSERTREDKDKLASQLNSEKMVSLDAATLQHELTELKQLGDEQEKDLTVLRTACQEKDRRIELLVHKRRKNRNNKAQLKSVRFLLPAKCPIGVPGVGGVKETYFGYDEDTLSLDSEMSSASCVSSHLSLDTSHEEDEVFEELARSDLEQNFQRLSREHLELEKSHTLLQAKVAQSNLDPQADNRDTGWLDEKETLTKTVRMLKEKIKNQEQHETREAFRIREMQEQNEELEFQTLELEEINEKLREEAKDTITIKEVPVLTDNGMLQMYAEEKGHMEIKLETLKEKLNNLKYAKDGHLEKSDKLVLLQARAMLGIADKKLKDLTTSQTVLKERVKTLEAEKAELLSAATGVSSDLILEHEETRHKLAEAEQKVAELEESLNNYKKSELVHKYTEERNAGVEARQKEEISSLQRKLRNSTEGREYESELWQENLERIRELEKDGVELQGRIANLCQNISGLEIDNAQLLQEKAEVVQQINQLRDTHDLAESDKETTTRLHSLQSKLTMAETQTTDLINRTTSLEAEVTSLKAKLDESEQIETEMTDRNIQIQDELTTTQDKCCHLERELGSATEKVAEIKDLLLAKDHSIADLEEKVQSLAEAKKDSDEKISELTASNEAHSHQVAAVESERKTIEELQKEVKSLQNISEDYRIKTEDLATQIQSLEKSNKDILVSNTSLENDLEISRKAQKEAENEATVLSGQSKSLLEKVRALELRSKEARDNELQTRDRLSLMEEEKSRRIQGLQDQVDKMEENEQRLSETITEMEEVENALRDQLQSLDTQDSPLDTGDSMETSGDVERLKVSEQHLLDQVEQMEHNERLLRERVAELEERLSEDSKRSDANEQIAELEARVQELAQSESKLLEDVYAMKLENQELQEHVDELLDQQESSESLDGDQAQGSVQTDEVKVLRNQLDDLEKENSDLTDQILKAKLSAMETLKVTDEERSQEQVALQERLNEFDESEDKLRKDLAEKETANKYLKEKVSMLTDAEQKLMEQIEFLEENQEKLNEEIKRLREAVSPNTSISLEKSGPEMTSRVKELESRESELKDTLEEMEDFNSSLKDKISKIQSEQTEEVQSLREKVNILLGTEEKLVNRLQEQEQVEERLHKKVDTEAKKAEDVKSQLEIYKAKCEQLTESIKQSGGQEAQNIAALEGKEKILKVRISELEKSEAVLRTKVSGLEESNRQKDQNEKGLREQVTSSKERESELRSTLIELEKADIALRTKLTSLESQKQELLDTIRASAQKSQVITNGIVPEVSSQASPAETNQGASQTSQTDKQLPSKMDSSFTMLSPTDIAELSEMPREAMISRIHELEQMEQFHMVKIKELSENLSTFRQAVEVVAVTMETDADIPLLSYKPKLRDTEFEARVQELLKSEVTLKLSNLELEKKEAILRSQLKEAESTLKKQTKEFRAELEDLEAELDHTRKAEARWQMLVKEGSSLPTPWAHRLKNKLQYGNWGQESQALAKIQHLENLVFDLESSERKLKRRVQEAQDSERDMKEKVARLEQAALKNPLLDNLKSLENNEKFYEILAKVKLQESSERGVEAKLGKLAVQDLKFDLRMKMDDLERSEVGLKQKLSLLEAQEASMNFEEDQTPIILDSPEAILRQRIRELERMEQHLKQQVVELERDREALHEIARKDKTSIHELSVRARELELSEKSLREQVGQLEVSENELHGKVDGLTDRVDELQATAKKAQGAEKHLKAQLQKHEYQESLLSTQLENSRQDLLVVENRLKKKSADIDSERLDLIGKKDEMFNRVGDLEGVEMSLRQKVRNLENSEVALKGKVDGLEESEKAAKLRAAELEAINEGLSQKIHTLSEEKSSLVFEMSDMEMLRSENNEDVQKLSAKLKSLTEALKDHELKKATLQKRLDEFADKEVRLQTRLMENERREKESKDKITELARERDQLRKTVQDLENKKVSTESRDVDLAELKRQTSNKMSQAHELLKKNHEDLKADHKQLQQQIKSGDVTVKDKLVTSSKSVQVRLADAYTISHLAPDDIFYHLESKEEFKNALKNLGARHPEAYQDFVRALQPTASKTLSLVRVTGEEASPTAHGSTPQTSTPNKQGKLLKMSDSGINEDFILAQSQEDPEEGNEKMADKPEMDDTTRKALIGQLVDTLADDKPAPEGDLWQVVEDKDPETPEKPYWAEVEDKNGPRDDMTVTVDVWGITTTDESGSETGLSRGPGTRSASSMASQDSEMSAPPPPLPTSNPPPPHRASTPSNDSFFMPDGDSSESADEASEIEDEDDGATPLRFPGLRAKSLERDSDYSEGSFYPSSSSRPQRTRKSLRVAGSLDSIPDSGTGSYKQDEIVRHMKERIVSLERQIKESEKKDEITALKSQDILASNSQTLLTGNKEMTHLKTELEKKNSELNVKTNEIERLTKELHRCQNNAKTEQPTAKVNMPAQASSTAESMSGFDKTYAQIQQSYKNLKVENEALKCQIGNLDDKTSEVSKLEQTLADLREQLTEFDRLELQRKDLEIKVKALEDELRRKAQNESEITQENARVLREIDSLKHANKHYLVMERDYNIVKSKFSEMEQIKTKALTMITPLRAKVIRLAGMCKSKDELIGRLAAELRRAGEHSESTVEAERALTHGASEEYSRPISPLTAHNLQVFEKELTSPEVGKLSLIASKPQKSQIPRRKRSSSDDTSSLDDTSSSDIEVSTRKPHGKQTNGETHRERYRRSRSSDDLDDLISNGKKTIDDFVVKPPQLALAPVTQLGRNNAPEAPKVEQFKRPSLHMVKSNASSTCEIYRAIKRYDPKYFSTSGHQRLELSLNEGDLVKILSDKDSHGYYEAEVDGKVGLVPALYLQPVNSTATRNTQKSRNGAKQFSSSHLDSSPEQILSFYNQLQQSHVPNHNVTPSSGPTSLNDPPIPRPLSVTGDPPLVHPAFHKSPRTVLSPRSPRDGARHPAYLHGYQNQPVSNGAAMQNFCPPEPPTDFCIQRAVGDHSLLLSWTPPAMDELARSNGIVIKGYKIYINGRDKQTIPSPHMSKALLERLDLRKSLTLSIQTAAENGLLSRFVEAICDGDLLDRNSHEGRDGDLSSFFSSSPRDDGDRKVFLAIYDYSPRQQSPNVNTSEELTFKTGDIIVTTGSVHEDGFYYGKVHGRKGLVPASFMEEIAVLRSQGRRSICSSTSLASNLFSPASSMSGSHPASTATLDRSRPPSTQSNRSSNNSYTATKASLATV